MKLRCVRCGAEFKVPDPAETVVVCPICGSRYRRGGTQTVPAVRPTTAAPGAPSPSSVTPAEAQPAGRAASEPLPSPAQGGAPAPVPSAPAPSPPAPAAAPGAQTRLAPVTAAAPAPQPPVARPTPVQPVATPPVSAAPEAEPRPRTEPPSGAASPDTPTYAFGAEAFMPVFLAGDLVAGRYRIRKFLARGGMGEVYDALDLELNSEVALKTVDPRVAADEHAVERFKREIQLARRVTHPNVCRIFDVGFHAPAVGTNGRPIVFLTMELLSGETLAARLRRDGPMPPTTALPLLRQIAAGLGAAHKAGIVHRDFKSENVFLVPDAADETGLRAVIADFGIARGAAEDPAAAKLTMAGGVVGTPAYMSPEQLAGETVTPASDIYAFGLVMFEMVTGHLPFEGDTAIATAVKRLTEEPVSPRNFTPSLDRRWEAVILHCLERRPEDRYASAVEAVAALEAEASGRAPEPSARGVAARAAAGRRKKAIALSLLAIVLAIAVGSAVMRVRARRAAMAGIGAPRRSVAVLGFKNSSGRPEVGWISTALAEMLNTELAEGDNLRLVPGESVARVKVELSLGDTDSLSAETLRRLRSLLGADYVLAGSYTALPGGSLRLDLRLQDARAGEALKPVSESGDEAGLFELTKKAGESLRDRLGVEGGGSGSGWWSADRWNPDATRLYSEGLAKLRNFEPQAARELLEKAVAADPKSPLSRSALAAAWSALGYGARAAEEAKQALDLSADLPREQRLEVEGRYAEVTRDYARGVEVYGALFDFYRDNLDYGLRLAANQTAMGQADQALMTVQTLRALPEPQRSDPRIDLEAANAAGARSDFKMQQQAAARAADTAAAQGARLLVAQARVAECWAWRNLGDPARAITTCQQAESLYREAGNRSGQASALTAWAGALYDQGELPGARGGYEQALATYREIGDQNGVARALNNIAVVLRNQGDLPSAKAMYEQTLAICRETGDKTGIASTLNNEAALLVQEGDLAGARALFEQTLALRREIGDQSGVAYALSNIGGVLRQQGDLAGARARHEEALSIRNSIGQRIGSVASLNSLGRVLLDSGDLAGAKREFDEALVACREIQNRSCAANALAGLAEVALHSAEPESANRQAGEALSIREQIGERGTAAESKVLLGWIGLENGDYAAASKTLAGALQDLADLHMPDQQALAASLLARCRLQLGDKGAAQRAANDAAGYAKDSQNRLARIAVAIAEARVRAAVPANRTAAIAALRQARADAEASGLVWLQYDARFAAGEIEMANSDRVNGRTDLIALAADAARQGYELMARRAGKAARG